MAADNSLNQSIGKAQKHYRSLFFLPSLKLALIGVAALCMTTGMLSAVFLQTVQGLVNGLLLGAVLFAGTYVGDLALSSNVLKDPIFVLRRTVVLSLFSWFFWFLLILVGVGLGLTLGVVWWIKLCLLGFATLLTLRTVVLTTVSSASLGRRLSAILLQPVVCIIPLASYWVWLNVSPIEFLPFIFASPFVALGFGYLFIRSLDLMGKGNHSNHSISIIDVFRAFMLNWVLSLNSPLESYLEKMGENADICVSFIKFDSAKPKAAFVVPQVHPGPFKNIGSSLLPSLLKEEYEKSIGGDVCVPLGLLGHEMDAASQAQNHKIISEVVAAAAVPASIEKATQLARVSEGFVTASCQLFGNTAFLSFTLAPKTTEDLPAELGHIVSGEAAKLGFDVVLVNAHNSLTDSVVVEASLEEFKCAAVKCLQKVASMQQTSFVIGSATIHPKEFTLKDGLGTGGITAVIIETGKQKTTYVVIDGNNMISGLREKIQLALSQVGFEESEVFTTDTHAVSAVVVGRRGYHPVGEAMDQEVLINHIVECVQKAEAEMEPCRMARKTITVHGVRVIGGGFLNSITLLVDQTIQKAKRIIAPVFAAEGGLLILLLLFL